MVETVLTIISPHTGKTTRHPTEIVEEYAKGKHVGKLTLLDSKLYQLPFFEKGIATRDLGYIKI